MAARNGIQKLLLQEMQEIKADLKEVRTKDIPGLQTAMEVMKEKTSFTSKLYATIGGGIAVLISAAMYLWK